MNTSNLKSPSSSASPHDVQIHRAPDERPHFLSEAECQEIAHRLQRIAGNAYTEIGIHSAWTGNVRWARNQIQSGGEDLNHKIEISVSRRGAAAGSVIVNEVSDAALQMAVRTAERMSHFSSEQPQSDLRNRYTLEPALAPKLFSDATYQLDASRRADAARQLMQTAAAQGMLSAGYIEVSAHSLAMITSLRQTRYFKYTYARYTTTVRDPKGTGSGWAGLDSYDWNQIDGAKLSTIALDKCLKSRNPVAVEPGRYTTILEPQAVCDFVGQLCFSYQANEFTLSKPANSWEFDQSSVIPPFNKTPASPGHPGVAQLDEKVVDERITIRTDPMDPELGYPPFAQPSLETYVYHPVTWIEHGVLKNLAYDRDYAIRRLGVNTGLPNQGSFRMSGGTTSIAEMISTTKRGLLVTRFDNVMLLHLTSQLCRGYSRDGLWLIEDGKISKPVKNMVFTESILYALNKVQMLGVPQRVFHAPEQDGLWLGRPPQPVIVPPLKVSDFCFTALADAV